MALITFGLLQQMREEQNILYRSVTAAETLSPMKNRCSYNINPVTIDASGKLTTYQRENDKIEVSSQMHGLCIHI